MGAQARARAPMKMLLKTMSVLRWVQPTRRTAEVEMSADVAGAGGAVHEAGSGDEAEFVFVRVIVLVDVAEAAL